MEANKSITADSAKKDTVDRLERNRYTFPAGNQSMPAAPVAGRGANTTGLCQ